MTDVTAGQTTGGLNLAGLGALGALLKRGDIALAVGVMTILVVLILPLPAMLLELGLQRARGGGGGRVDVGHTNAW